MFRGSWFVLPNWFQEALCQSAYLPAENRSVIFKTCPRQLWALSSEHFLNQGIHLSLSELMSCRDPYTETQTWAVEQLLAWHTCTGIVWNEMSEHRLWITPYLGAGAVVKSGQYHCSQTVYLWSLDPREVREKGSLYTDRETEVRIS